MPFPEAVSGLLAGDFSRLAPLFKAPSDGSPCPIIKWFEDGLFASETKALEEAFTCAHLRIIEVLLQAGAQVGAADYPSGDERVDELLRACFKIVDRRRVRARGLQEMARIPQTCRPGPPTGRFLKHALRRHGAGE